MNVQQTTCRIDGTLFEAIRISWDDIEELLGRPHEGTEEDDSKISDALEDACNVPTWALYAKEGAILIDGYYLLGPLRWEEE